MKLLKIATPDSPTLPTLNMAEVDIPKYYQRFAFPQPILEKVDSGC